MACRFCFFRNVSIFTEKQLIIKPYLYLAKHSSELCQPASILHFDVFIINMYMFSVPVFVLDIVSNTFFLYLRQPHGHFIYISLLLSKAVHLTSGTWDLIFTSLYKYSSNLK